jgi:hypothetical protein
MCVITHTLQIHHHPSLLFAAQNTAHIHTHGSSAVQIHAYLQTSKIHINLTFLLYKCKVNKLMHEVIYRIFNKRDEIF